MKLMLTIIAVLLAAIAFVGDADAASILRFDNGDLDGGVLAYGGEGGTLIGRGIQFENLIATGTPQNSGTFDCISCFLRFETGLNLSESPYFWAAGGSITLTGTIQVEGGGPIVASGTLLQGEFGDNFALAGAQFIFSALGTDEKHYDILEYFGLENSFDFASTNIAAEYVKGANGSILGNVTDADLTNEARLVPGLASVLMVGFGLLVAGVVRRKQLS